MNGETTERHPYQGTLLSHKKGETTNATTCMDLEGLLLSKQNSISKGYMLYDCIYITSLRCHSYRNREQVNDFQGLRRQWQWVGSSRSHKRAMKDPYADGNVLYLDH